MNFHIYDNHMHCACRHEPNKVFYLTLFPPDNMLVLVVYSFQTTIVVCTPGPAKGSMVNYLTMLHTILTILVTKRSQANECS